MVRAKGSLLACAALLDHPSWANNNNFNFNFHSGAIKPGGVLQDRLPPTATPTPLRTATASAGNAEPPAHHFSSRGKRGGATGCEGRTQQEAFVPSFSATSRGRSSRGPTPWQQRRPSASQAEVMCGCGRLASRSPRRRDFTRGCVALVLPRTTHGLGLGLEGDPRPPLGPFMTATRQDDYARPEVPKWAHKAVIIPGFATDARAFEKLCYRLERRGIASVVVPIRWYHWLPTLGGRSVRPILDRIHETVIRCVGAPEHRDMPYAFNEPGLQDEVAPYTAGDFWAEMGDPKLGAHHMGPLDLPVLPTEPSADERVILIAHSAGGWMSRIYLSEASYDGRTYNASYLVNGLVTLGTPHVRLEDDHGRNRELPFSRNFKFVEESCTGKEGGYWEKRVPTSCIGGATLQGRSTFGGLFKDLVYQSYELCCGDGSGTGDGITPLKSAFDMAGAKRYVELEGVLHAAGLGGPWYGSDDVIDSWLEPSLDAFFGPPERQNDDGVPNASNAGLKSSPEMLPVVVRDEDTAGKDAA